MSNDHIEADDRVDVESDYSSSAGSDTTSVSSTVYNYQYENGRRYHNFRAGKYLLPNDEAEQERLDLAHHFICIVMGGELHKAPLKDPKSVLDVGTGTGIWAIDFGDTYPDAEVIGVDLSPIQPTWVPPNVKFEVDDVEDTWTYPPNKFDYIHIRGLVGSIKDWKKLFERALECTKPGGYIEVQEGDVTGPRSDDGTYRPESAYGRYTESLLKASHKFGARLDIAPELAGILKDAGWSGVTEHKFKSPCGPWAKNPKLKESGKYQKAGVYTGLEAYGLALFTRALGMTQEDAQKLCDGAREDLDNPKIHMYFNLHFIYGQKPLDSE